MTALLRFGEEGRVKAESICRLNDISDGILYCGGTQSVSSSGNSAEPMRLSTILVLLRSRLLFGWLA